MNYDRVEIAVFGTAALIAVLCVVAMVVSIVQDIQHPCLKYGAAQQCVYFQTTGDVTVPILYDCTPCVERAP